MWWDIFIIYGARDDLDVDPLNLACLEVMEKSITLSNIAVQEGALHGLGHFEPYYPDVCHPIIERFLKLDPTRDPGLQEYALNALSGYIL
jgi:hypothetical protein